MNEQQRRAQAVRIFRGEIARDPVGRTLTDDAQMIAAEFAADAWKGTTNAGAAREIGIKHVTKDILK